MSDTAEPSSGAPTGSPPSTPSSPVGDDDNRRRSGIVVTWKQLLTIAIVLLLVGGGIGLGLWLSSGSKSAASEVFLQPTHSAGTNPFTAPVGSDVSVPTATSSALRSTPGTPAGSLASYSGDSIGLYGGTRSLTSCNPQQMIDYLEANPAKASAWASAEGIPVGQLATYISSLTPMTLRYDTRVTNHGFNNGVANPIPEILQAGQAVLADRFGVPRARCYCGNPLTPPVPMANPTYVGRPWPGFSPATVVVVQQSTTIINNFTVIDSNTGVPFNRPAGTTGSSDGPAMPSPNQPTMPGVTTPPPGSTTTSPPATTPSTPPPPSTTSPPATTPSTAPNGQPLGTGAVQITLTWSTMADLDLHVIEPSGTEIDYGNKTSSTGGTLDVDSNGSCQNPTSNPVENVFWPSSGAPTGAYTVNVAYYEECGGAGSGPQSYTVTVTLNGQVVQQKTGTISYTGGTPQQATTFNVG